VVDVGGGHGELGGREERRRTRREEASFTDHVVIVASLAREAWASKKYL
jgi:hypothetical protein